MLSAVAVSEHVDETAILGQDLTYTVVVSNLGTVTATGVTVTDVLPLSLEPASATSTGICVTDDLPDDVSLISAIPTQGICSSYPDVVCELEQLSPANSAEVSVKASIAVSMRGQLLNTVVASSTAPDNKLGEQRRHGGDSDSQYWRVEHGGVAQRVDTVENHHETRSAKLTTKKQARLQRTGRLDATGLRCAIVISRLRRV